MEEEESEGEELEVNICSVVVPAQARNSPTEFRAQRTRHISFLRRSLSDGFWHFESMAGAAASARGICLERVDHRADNLSRAHQLLFDDRYLAVRARQPPL